MFRQQWICLGMCGLFLFLQSECYGERISALFLPIPPPVSDTAPLEESVGPALGVDAAPAARSVVDSVPTAHRSVENTPSRRVVENPDRPSLDGLRRRIHRYSEQDLPGRFVEISTERPPLFGSED